MLALAVGVACGPIVQAPVSTTVVNTCSTQSDCPQGSTCIGGSCFVLGQTTGSLAIISTSQDSDNLPGITTMVSLAQLLMTGPPPGVTCAGNCVSPPDVLSLAGSMFVSPDAQKLADWNLGNGNLGATMPVQATFWPQWPSGATSYVDAVSVGLPLGPVDLANASSGVVAPGPGGGPGLSFSNGALPPLVYQRVLQPLPPFDEAYPPDVHVEDLSQKAGQRQVVDFVPLQGASIYDTTTIGAATGFPTYDLSRSDGGSLDGWTAWLRDQTTQRRISNLARLRGTTATGVQLLTRHVPAGTDALTNAQLVLSPDAGSGLPIWIYTPPPGGLPRAESYPALPPSFQASGTVTSSATGHAIAADLVFEATGLCRSSAGQLLLDSNGDYSFTRRLTTGNDGKFTVSLPLGTYKVTIIPHDTSSAVTVVGQYLPGLMLQSSNQTDQICRPVSTTPPLSASKVQTITGVASIGSVGGPGVFDGRPLAGAIAEALPLKCSDGSVDPACLPRAAQAQVQSDGSYTLSLDQGAYLLRVRPAQGSLLPWIVQPLVVPSPPKAPPTTVPAPVHLGRQLVDAKGNPIAEAILRIFDTPSAAAPREIGMAVTDADGNFDLYLAPSQ